MSVWVSKYTQSKFAWEDMLTDTNDDYTYDNKYMCQILTRVRCVRLEWSILSLVYEVFKVL